jgi:hypothetical protein
MGLEDLTVADFAPRVGERFAIALPDGELELVLRSADAVADRPGGRDPFSLIFGGPEQPRLAQAIYPLEHAELGVLEIFIVPIAGDAEGTTYQAVFS